MLAQVVSGVVVAAMLSGGVAFAQRGGGARMSRGAAAGSVSRIGGGDFNRSVDANRNLNSNVNVNRSTNVNRDVNWDRDVDVNVDHHYGGFGYGCCYNPVGAAAAATAAAVTTAAVVGSMVHTLPPSCDAVSINGFTYQHCGATWYQPQFSGSAVTYVVVNPPR
jgi:hypothetical protein